MLDWMAMKTVVGGRVMAQHLKALAASPEDLSLWPQLLITRAPKNPNTFWHP